MISPLQGWPIKNIQTTMKKLLPLFAIFFHLGVLFAQPQPCVEPAAMTSFCADACIICDINGFTGINNSTIQGQEPAGFCTTTAHHMQWIGFIAGSTNLTLAVSVFNCQGNGGLEVGIYKSLNCTTFQLVSNCDGDILPNTTVNFTNIVPLTIGQYYYFVMDGNQNDICEYKITVVSGTTEVTPLSTSGNVSGDFTVCPGRSELYELEVPTGAARFEWTLNGTPIGTPQDTAVTVDWSLPGNYNLCVTASNTCDTASPTCRTIVCKIIPPTILNEQICSGDCFEIGDTTICDAGSYELHFQGQEGCDSTVMLTLSVFPSVVTDLDLRICEGDTIFIGTQACTTSGQFQEILVNQYGCDSTVNLALQVIVCQIQGEILSSAVGCKGDTDGVLTFKILNGTPPFAYTWERIGQPTPTGLGSINALNQVITLSSLPAGQYIITVTDGFGNIVILLGTLSEPTVLTVSTILSDFLGLDISCNGATDGSIEAIPNGGTAPYQYQWSNGTTNQTLTNVGAGSYSLTLTDANNCSLSLEQSLENPDSLLIEGIFTDPNCLGINTGTATAINIAGGNPPYQYALNGGIFQQNDTFNGLIGGNYTLSVQDTNGCVQSVVGDLITPLIPEIDLGIDQTLTLGDSIRLNINTNIALSNIVWSPSTGLSCSDCPNPFARPGTTTTYTVEATAAIGECTDRDSITLEVIVVRNVYIPNAFSPDGNGVNDWFTVFGGGGVVEVEDFKIFSRWGELLFERQDFSPNLENLGWDGTYKGKTLPPDVFTYFALVNFLDGTTIKYQGSVSIIR
jgi:gliding motility-associated-like protein